MISSINKMFKAYDIRGTVPNLNAKHYYLVGKALIEEVFGPENLPLKIILGRDCRYSSPEFYSALSSGIISSGGEILPLGVCSSDFLYASTQVFNLPGAIVTASHNPKDDNGLKIVKSGSTMLGLSEGLDKVREYVIKNYDSTEYPTFYSEIDTDQISFDKTKEYFLDKITKIGQIPEINQILKSRNQKLRIVADAGNGMGGFVMNLIKDLYPNIEFIQLYWDLDGNFPNHPADPQDFENLTDIRNLILSGKADFGMAFDGDADRVFFVDDKAEVVQGDFLVAFFAQSLLEAFYQNPNPKFNPAVVFITPGSRCVPEAITQADGIAIPSTQGHTGIKARMSKHKAIYGGEFSGHHYFAEFGFMDSGVLASVLMIKIIVQKQQLLSEIFQPLKNYYFISDLMNPRLPEGKTFEDLVKVIQVEFKDARFSYYDGISVFYLDWKFSLRPSNTEPVVRFILETRGQNKVNEKVKLVRKILGI